MKRRHLIVTLIIAASTVLTTSSANLQGKFTIEKKQIQKTKELKEIHKHQVQKPQTTPKNTKKIPRTPDKKNPLPQNNHQLIRQITPEENLLPSINLSPEQNPQTYNLGFCHMLWNENMPALNHELIQEKIDHANEYFQEMSNQQVRLNLQGIYNTREDLRDQRPLNTNTESLMAINSCNQNQQQGIDAWILYPSINQRGGGGAKAKLTTPNSTTEIPYVLLGKYNHQTGQMGTDSLQFSAGHLIHELGHAIFDLRHGEYLNCEHSHYGQFNEELLHTRLENLPHYGVGFENCHIDEYGYYADVMGTSLLSGHLSTWNKYLAGKWAKLQTITSDGSYLLTRVEDQTNNTQLLRIPIRGQSICIEYRQPISYDTSLTQENIQQTYNTNKGGIPPQGSIFLSICPGSGPYKGYNLLIDSKPEGLQQHQGHLDRFDAAINHNTNFQSPELGLTLNWQPQEQNKARVNLDIWNEEQIYTQQDIQATISWLNGKAAVCAGHINPARFQFELTNNSETEITTPFDVVVFTQEENNRTILDQFTVDNLKITETITKFYHHHQPQDTINIQAHIDINNEILEINEANNSTSIPGCK